MAKRNKPEQLEMFPKDLDPICKEHGCMGYTHFKSIRRLQAMNAELEGKLRGYKKS